VLIPLLVLAECKEKSRLELEYRKARWAKLVRRYGDKADLGDLLKDNCYRPKEFAQELLASLFPNEVLATFRMSAMG